MAQVLPSQEFAAAMAFSRQGNLIQAVEKLESARVNFVEGDSVTMDQIKKELQRLLTRFSLDPYMTLGVAQDVEVNAAKKAYRKLILKYHPDKNPHTSSLFRAVQQAFETISDEKKRREIDRQLSRNRSSGPRMRRASTASSMNGNYASAYARYSQAKSGTSKPPPPSARARRHSNFGPGGSAYQRPPPPPRPKPAGSATAPSPPKSRYHGKAWTWKDAGVPPPGGGAPSGSTSNRSRRSSYAPQGTRQPPPPPPSGTQSARTGAAPDYRAWAREYKRKMMEKKAAEDARKAGAGTNASQQAKPQPQPQQQQASGDATKPDARPAPPDAGGAAPQDYSWSGSSYSFSANSGPSNGSSTSTSRAGAAGKGSKGTSAGGDGPAFPRSRPSAAAPPKPSNGAATVPPGRTPRPHLAAKSDCTATLDWHAPTRMPVYSGVPTKITAYEVAHRQRAADLLAWGRAPTKTIVPTSSHPTAVVPNLKPSTCYEARVRAGSASGWGQWSEVVSFNTAPSLATKQAEMLKKAQQMREAAKRKLEEKHAREVEKARERIERAKQKAAGMATPRGGEPDPATPDGSTRFRGARRRASYVARMAAVERANGDALKAEEMTARANVRQRARERMAARQYGKKPATTGHTTPRSGAGSSTPRGRPAGGVGDHSDIEVEVGADAVTASKDKKERKERKERKSKRSKARAQSKATKSEGSVRAPAATPAKASSTNVPDNAGGATGDDASGGGGGGGGGGGESGGVMGGVKRWFKRRLSKAKKGTDDGGDAGHHTKPPAPAASKPKPAAAYLRTPKSARKAVPPSTPAPSAAQAHANVAATKAAEEGGTFWYEAYDASNGAYYYVHSVTNESRWDAPLWMEYQDVSTGCPYYVNSYTSASQWERPSDFVPVLRLTADGQWTSIPVTEKHAGKA